MGKHKNQMQDKIFLNFMSAHPNLANGSFKGDKSYHEEKWIELADLLNEAGPPTKDIFSWKKTWADWKSTIRKKLRRIKYEDNCALDGESGDKYTLSKIEDSINFICDLEKRDDATGTSNLYQSPFSSPLQKSQPNKKIKRESLRECFLEALTQNSRDKFCNDVEIKVEKEDGTAESYYELYQTNDANSFLNRTTNKRKNGKDVNHEEIEPQNSWGTREEKTKGFIEIFEVKLNGIDKKLDELGKKYDKLIDLKKEQIEEMKRDREERRRHNLEIEKYNSTLLPLKSEKDLVDKFLEKPNGISHS